MSLKPTPATRRAGRVPATFAPASTKPRQDGWTPERQVAFIEALAEGGCVDEACKRVGMGTSSAYALRRRADAHGFRHAWEAALDVAIERLSDAVFARAINGVTTPVFYKGEQVGERVRHDEKLAMFLLRYRDPARYGAWTNRWRAEQPPGGAADALVEATGAIGKGAAPQHSPVAPDRRYVAVHEQDVVNARRAADNPSAIYRATAEETDAAILKMLRAVEPRPESDPDGSCGSSTLDPGNRHARRARRAAAGDGESPP